MFDIKANHIINNINTPNIKKGKSLQEGLAYFKVKLFIKSIN